MRRATLAIRYCAAATAVIVSSTLAGCSSDRTQAAQVVEAVRRFRRADNRDKPAMAEALGAVRCTLADVCRVRDDCLASAEATAKALRLKNEVEIGISALKSGALARDSAEAEALPRKLDEAETLLKAGFERMPACDDSIRVLKRKYGI
ncbi:MAG: hypothetical protein FWD73_15285 [Polyangiaceae bacterium]|nr:hypothetical protein [Polyangiaceae bacterium]